MAREPFYGFVVAVSGSDGVHRRLRVTETVSADMNRCEVVDIASGRVMAEFESQNSWNCRGAVDTWLRVIYGV